MTEVQTYTAQLVNNDGTQTHELETIAGLPQKSFILPTERNGTTVDVVWELDPDSEDNTYRPTSGDGYGEGGITS
ncbi:hypothetical protein [Subtercola sp. YIM 133946]|uniref:hypothetical protein n=1 Tax=Subtercola sp. YIM 133946 TaxID=3118909 RepID=UPI002F95FD87